MVAIFKNKNKNGKVTGWHAVIRLKDYPVISKTFDRKQEAEDWGIAKEREIKAGQFNFDLHKSRRTLSDLVERYINDGVLENHKSAQDTIRHLNYWTERLGKFGLIYIIPELISKERKHLGCD
ncbi:MAG: hypothetical protein A3F40_04360 [Chlamydiae bacterium RIFCSPHIGHO2_12_FULL_27_8]|nr:MAG: hypothetical protein A3F40_04360 [Chlamydiae bacterium RIFCSPHIGHO2_12_FULL_27_8]OGN65142.1 MAG: hypothetical protein A2888_00705 [Chlamydiae bacterium RIFCSPLOWO2_01_FULL_28_7]